MYESPIHKRTPRAGSMAVKQAAVRTLSLSSKMKNKRKTQVGGYRYLEKTRGSFGLFLDSD